MAQTNEIHENDVGTEIILTIVDFDNNSAPVDISTATLNEIVFRRANNTTTTAAASFVTDGTDGKIHYYTQIGDFTPAGTYKIQGVVTTPAGTWHSTVDTFKVEPNL